MTLSSVITVSGVNISIIECHNPTINCNNTGGIKFTYCHNCTIEVITWDDCGLANINDRNIPVFEFYLSIDITIRKLHFSAFLRISSCPFRSFRKYKNLLLHFSTQQTT